MNEQEVRLIVREAVRRHLGDQSSHVPSPSAVQSSVQFVPESVAFGDHASHAMYMQLVNNGGACVIEEHVNCDHCGYCKSHGH